MSSTSHANKKQKSKLQVIEISDEEVETIVIGKTKKGKKAKRRRDQGENSVEETVSTLPLPPRLKKKRRRNKSNNLLAATSTSSSQEEESEESVMLDDTDCVETVGGEVENVDEGGILDYVPFVDGIWYRRHDEGSVLLLLEVGKRVYFSGRLKLHVVKGKVEVLGYILESAANNSLLGSMKDNKLKSLRTVGKAYSPKGHSSLLYIEGKCCGQEDDNLDDLTDLGLPHGVAAVILSGFENEWTSGFRNTAGNGDQLIGPEINTNIRPHSRLTEDEIELVDDGSKKKLPKMKQFLDKFGFQLIPDKLLEKNRLFITDLAWESFFERIINDIDNAGDFRIHEKISVFGGKGVGKSTFCRWLTNKYLSHKGGGQVLYIDLDPGQTEFTPPGVISMHLVSKPLLGPNFSHLRQPEKAIFLGGVNVADYPALYIHAVKELARFAVENYSNVPCIINTMGFSSGLGVPLAIIIIKIFGPSTLVELKISNNPKCSFPFALNPDNISTYAVPHFLLNNQSLDQLFYEKLRYNFIQFNSVTANMSQQQEKGNSSQKTPGGVSPKSLRENMLISYFSEQIGYKQNVLAVVPYRVRLGTMTIGCMNSSLDWDGVLRTLIGNLVALCKLPPEVETSSQMEVEQAQPITSKSFISSCSRNNINDFLGYGLCRAVDKAANELMIVTPVSKELLNQVGLIICAGEVGLPVSLVLGSKNNNNNQHAYISGQLSRLNVCGKKTYVPGKKSIHTVYKD